VHPLEALLGKRTISNPAPERADADKLTGKDCWDIAQKHLPQVLIQDMLMLKLSEMQPGQFDDDNLNIALATYKLETLKAVKAKTEKNAQSKANDMLREDTL